MQIRLIHVKTTYITLKRSYMFNNCHASYNEPLFQSDIYIRTRNSLLMTNLTGFFISLFITPLYMFRRPAYQAVTHTD